MDRQTDGVCEHCWMDGLHPDCEEGAARRDAERFDRLRRFSARGQLGPQSPAAFATAVRRLALETGRSPRFSVGDVIEGASWFYIPWIVVGCPGWIVEKDGGAIRPLDSGKSLEESLDAFRSGAPE